MTTDYPICRCHRGHDGTAPCWECEEELAREKDLHAEFAGIVGPEDERAARRRR